MTRHKKMSETKRWFWVSALIPFLGLPLSTNAQQGSSGNTTIFGGAQMTLFANHNFNAGSGGTQPGIINTIRTSPMGVLNFGSAANTATGADDANYVDGYVRKLGSSSFIFPVGDNGHYGPFTAAADGTTGAYFFTNPNSAVTSMLPSGNYPALPAGGPFATTSKGAGVNTVSIIEYWDIDGANATKISLTWDATSAIGSLTGNDLSKLTIVGWDGTRWVVISSAVDATSVLGAATTLSSGSITTSASISPNTYSAYTFASATTIVTQLPFNCSSLSYVIGNRNISGSNVSDGYTLDLTTGTATLAKADLLSGPNAFVNAIGYNTVDNYIWGFRYNTDELVRIGSDWSVETFPVTGFPATIPGFATGDVNAQGVLYLYAANSSTITKIDLNPASANYLIAVTVPTTPTDLNDWAFNPVDGLLYAFGTNKILYRFDPVTGARTTLGAVTGGISAQSGAFGTAFFDEGGDFFVGNNLSGSIFKLSAPLTNLTSSLFSTTNMSPGDGARCANAVVADPPVASNDNSTTTPRTPVQIPTLGNDTQGSAAKDPTTVLLVDPADGLKKTTVTITGEGTYTVNTTTGVVTFDPDFDFNNAISTISYTYKDVNGIESNPATITVSIGSLPVTLISFTAIKEGESALLNWSTTLEVNSERFDIEHSLNAKSWNKIGSVRSHGESTTKRDYSFVHANLAPGENLYRLKMTDRDGTFAYSRIQGVRSDVKVELSAYPNPVTDRLLFKNYTMVNELAVYSATGQKVMQTRVLTAEGIDLTHLGAGIYTVKLTLTDGSLSTQKIVVIK